MKFDTLRLLFFILLLGAGNCGCQKFGKESESAASNAVSCDVVCTAWPLMEMARALAGESLTVQLIEPELGLSWRNRRSWFPDDRHLELLPQARLVIENGPGVPYVSWVELAAVAGDRTCNSSINFKLDDYIPVKD